MRGFPGFVNQKVGGGPVASPALPANSLPSAPKLPNLNAPAVPTMPVLARPVPVVVVPVVPVVAVMATRPATVATVTRNLQAALGPELPTTTAPTTKGFPGFVSRNFNQVSQHQPSTSNAAMLNGLANLMSKPAPPAPDRRQAPRPAAPPAAPPASPPSSPPAPQSARPLVKIPEAPKAIPQPLARPMDLPRPPVLARPVLAQPTKAPQPPAQPKIPGLKAAELPKLPALNLPKLAAPELPKLQPVPEVAQKRSLAQKPVESQATVKAAEKKAPEAQATEVKTGVETPKVETKIPEVKPTKENQQAPRPSTENKPNERVEGPKAANAVSVSVSAPARATTPTPEKAVTRAENTELKVGEAQRQQVTSQQTPSTREQLTLAQQCGAGLSAGGGHGQGGGGGQQGRRQRQQDQQEGEVAIDEIHGADALGGDDQVQWWHLRGEENVHAFSSELREAMHAFRSPQDLPNIEFTPVRSQSKERGQERPQTPPVVVEEEAQRLDGVTLQGNDGLCLACGNELGGLDPRRCPACLKQAALETLVWLQADPRFIAYRVFLTLCRQPVSSRAVYRLRDFASLPQRAYCVQAA